MIRNKKILTGLDHTSYEHPFDQKALSALESTPGLDLVGKFITKNMVERVYTVQYTGSHLRATKDSILKSMNIWNMRVRYLTSRRFQSYT